MVVPVEDGCDWPRQQQVHQPVGTMPQALQVPYYLVVQTDGFSAMRCAPCGTTDPYTVDARCGSARVLGPFGGVGSYYSRVYVMMVNNSLRIGTRKRQGRELWGV